MVKMSNKKLTAQIPGVLGSWLKKCCLLIGRPFQNVWSLNILNGSQSLDYTVVPIMTFVSIFSKILFIV